MLPFRVRVDLSSDPIAWGEWEADRTRFDLVWPPGFSLRVDDGGAVVLDRDGMPVLLADALIEDAAGSGGDPFTVCALDGKTFPLE